MSYETLLYQVADGVATITLNRPAAFNSLSPAAEQELSQALGECRAPAVRAVVLTGSGRAFCAGADVKEFSQAQGTQGKLEFAAYVREYAHRLHRDIVLPLAALAKPTVAAVNGVAAGAGIGLALACDLRIAAEDARFVMAYSNIGATGDASTTYLLPRLIGQGRTMELYLLNEPLDAPKALRWGLVNQVVAPAELVKRAQEVAAKLAQGPTAAYGRMRALLSASWQSSLETHLGSEAHAIGDMAATHDFEEGIRAFAEKRAPRFTGD
ncbi:MAG: enoyl-CoA hydratase/isomerase family protein [Chloroflexi bacterium]|nr:enoyl-CoA hydratase/isomerase family protein [Chloroflexota bacterium]